MGHWDDPDIREASGMAGSLHWASIGYVQGDENSPMYTVNLTTSKTVGRTGVKGHSLVDPEDLDIDSLGHIWLLDGGNNTEDPDRVPCVYKIREPGPDSYHNLAWEQFGLRFPGGDPHNTETFINWPNGKQQVVSKEDEGVVYQLPPKPKTSGTNQMTAVHGPDSWLENVSGAVVSKDGKWVFVIRAGHNSSIEVFNAKWGHVDTLSMPTMEKPEGISIRSDGKYLFVCDDTHDANGAYQRVAIPSEYRPVEKPYKPPPPNAPPANPCAA